jgi:hypothetical protein
VTIVNVQGTTDEKGDLLVHVGHPNTSVTVNVTVADPSEMSQEQWSARFEELASQVDASAFERQPQSPVRDPFDDAS